MASLVADYSDSDSEDECLQASRQDAAIIPRAKEEIPDIKQEAIDVKQETIDIKQEATDIKQEAIDIKQEAIDIKQETCDANMKPIHSNSSSNFFMAPDNDDDDQEDEDDESSSVTTIKSKGEKTSSTVSKLPNPMTSQRLPSINDASSLLTGASVFINPFEREEQAKNKILERHVQLTEAAPKKPAHQPMCWKFKKGKCHLGKNCRFFHDRDTLSVDDSAIAESSKANPANERHRSAYHPAAYRDARRRPLDSEPVDDDNYMASMKKKKRFGINDALMPPKKAYESLLQMRQKERPWTMPSAPS